MNQRRRRELPYIDLYDEPRYEAGREPRRREGSRNEPPSRRAEAPPVRRKKGGGGGGKNGGGSRGGRVRVPARRGMSSSSVAVIALFFGFVIVYMALRATEIFSVNVDIMTVRMGNMESQQSVPGMIVRHEQVFHADRDGRVVFNVQEFDRVTGGNLVASIRDIDAVSRNEQEMALLHREIISLSEMRHATQVDPLVGRVNNNLNTILDRNMHHHMQTNLSDVYNLLETLTQITDNRNAMIINESVHVRNDLYRQHDYLTNQRAVSLNDIYADRTGIMSPIIDGFESLVTPANMRDLSRDQVRMTVNHEAIVPGREVSAGDEIFKIVDNTWYVAASMPNDMVSGWTVGSDRTIFLENATTGRFEPVFKRVYYMRHGHRETHVIFRSSRNVIEFLHQRNVNIRTTDNIESGLIIPTSAIATRRFYRIPLTHVHGYERYFLMHRHDDGVLHQIPVYIYDRTSEYAYIRDMLDLHPGDTIAPIDAANHLHHLISENDIRIVRGVYNTNRNYAVFREINIEGEILDGSGSILLDPVRNPTVRQFDNIVTDASMVRQGQIVR